MNNIKIIFFFIIFIVNNNLNSQNKYQNYEQIKLEYQGRINDLRFEFTRTIFIKDKLNVYYISNSDDTNRMCIGKTQIMQNDSNFLMSFIDNSKIFDFMDTFLLYCNRIDTSKLNKSELSKLRIQEPKKWYWVEQLDTLNKYEICIEKRKGSKKYPGDRYFSMFIRKPKDYRANIQVQSYMGIPIKYIADISKYSATKTTFFSQDFYLKKITFVKMKK